MRGPRGTDNQQYVGGATTGFLVPVAALVVLDRLGAAEWSYLAVVAVVVVVAALVAWRIPAWRTYALASMAWPLAGFTVWAVFGLIALVAHLVR